MSRSLDRRQFLSFATASAAGCVGASLVPRLTLGARMAADPLFQISLAEWSLNKALF